MTETEEKIISMLGEVIERLNRLEQARTSHPMESQAWAKGKLIELQKRRENRKRRHGSAITRD
jgi:hypothetical protein